MTTWGAAVERWMSPELAVLAEAFGENTRAHVRAGTRWNATPRLAFDLPVVTRLGGTREERYVCLGVFLQSPPFLP